MIKLIVGLVVVGLSFALSDGESLLNSGGEHVILGVEEGTTDIKWIKVDGSGYLITTVVPSADMAPSVGIENLTAGVAETSYAFGGETALSFSILNTDSTNILYVGLATGGDYITVYPHASFSIPSCGEADIWYKASGATTTFDIVFTY